MVKKILGGLFAIWGAAILINHFFIEKPPAARVGRDCQKAFGARPKPLPNPAGFKPKAI